VLELDDESKIIKKLFVIKDICSWLPPRLNGWNVCSKSEVYMMTPFYP